MLNAEKNLTRESQKLISCSWFTCELKTEVRIIDLDTCAAQIKLENGLLRRAVATKSATWHFYFLNNVLKSEITTTPFPGRGFVVYRIKLKGQDNIYCEYGASGSDFKGGCVNEIKMYVSDDKIAEFKAVLRYILDDVCTGAKRENKF